jgi:hypothetical protein
MRGVAVQAGRSVWHNRVKKSLASKPIKEKEIGLQARIRNKKKCRKDNPIIQPEHPGISEGEKKMCINPKEKKKSKKKQKLALGPALEWKGY